MNTTLSLRRFLIGFVTLLLSGQQAIAQTPIAVGPQTSTFTSWVRGYHFTAPTSFTICGLYIPDDASTQPQYVEVVKFTSAAPPAYTATTNAFTSLFYQANWVPNTMIPCNITVNAGDIIGVYGARGTTQVNSYSSPNYVSNILGFPVTFQRSGMQASLATQQMANIWSEVGFSIGRIIMYVNCCNAVPPGVSNVTYCQYDVPQQLTATGINLQWYTSATGGVGSAVAPTPSTATPGTTTYYVSALGTSPANCETGRMPITVTVNAKPAPPTINYTQTYCPGAAFTPFQVTTGQNVKWYTAATGGVGSTTTPVVNTSLPGTYTWYASQTVLGCESDRVQVSVQVYSAVNANFNYSIKYGCDQDTVTFTNTSIGGIRYQWSFGDGQGDTAKNVTHIYKSQQIFNVKLKAEGTYCKDSITQAVDLEHPLDASFTVDDDSVCQFQTVIFTNSSVTTVRNGINPTWFWDFGDGGTSTQQNPTHTYTRTGVYNVRMIVKDFVPCYDTAWHTIVVDSIPHAFFTLSDSVLCEGQGITMTADILELGNTRYFWNLGDGTILENLNPIQHAYDSAGLFTVTLTAEYRICDDATYTKDLLIKSFPAIDLGPDTALCPNGAPIVISDRINEFNPAATWQWNTGATDPVILARAPGTYSATVSLEGCENTDSMTVFKDCYLDIPNAFTPNGDGSNDYFLPRQLLSSGATSFRMVLFNRWGQKIFETSALEGRGWDGKFNNEDQPTGVYVYQIEAAFKNGARERYTGNVTLMR